MDILLKTLKQNLKENQTQNYSGDGAKEHLGLVKNGQSPQYFFISCSDSRYDPSRLPHVKSGDIFVHQHVAALVPEHGSSHAIALEAALDYGINALKIPHIIIMGHTHCGGVQALKTQSGPASVLDWMNCAKDATHTDQCSVKSEEHTIAWSYHNLEKYPSVAKAMSEGKLSIHAWHYDIETAQVSAYTPETHSFAPLF